MFELCHIFEKIYVCDLCKYFVLNALKVVTLFFAGLRTNQVPLESRLQRHKIRC